MLFKTFRGGTHPPESKEQTASLPIEEAPIPPEVVISLHQHTGAPCKPLVTKGDKVLAGQKIGEADAFVAAPVCASVAGEVKAVEDRLSFTGAKVLSVVIAPAEEQDEAPIEGARSAQPSPDEVRKITREAGLVGLGGAAFPTHVKLSPPKDKKIDSVIVNGCECEPYLTCDHRLMLEESDKVVEGLKIIMQTLGAQGGYIGIEDNKKDAIALLSQKISSETNIKVIPLPTKYPQGAEKQLIKVILNREVPSGGLPFDVATYVQNVGTTISIYEAVKEKKALTSRVITVTGHPIRNPKNLRVRIGTPVSFLIDVCGGFKEKLGKVIVGGPMTGFAQFDLSVPIVKGTSGIVVLSKDEVRFERPHLNPCIRCARCIDGCPAGLMPNAIALYSKVELWEMVDSYNVFDCIECGACSYVCPARIPHIQFIKLAKAKIESMKKGSRN